VAFSAAYNNGNNTGIFMGDGGPLTTVIKFGDSLFGSTVGNLGMGRFALDPGGNGNLAFWYQLADGRTGIALASPVPEPPTWAMLVAVAAAAACVSLRRRHSASAP
jgi:hypothetical protein